MGMKASLECTPEKNSETGIAQSKFIQPFQGTLLQRESRDGMQYAERKQDHEKFWVRQDTLQQVCTLLGMITQEGKSDTAGERELMECFPQTDERGQHSSAKHEARPQMRAWAGHPPSRRKQSYRHRTGRTVDVVVGVGRNSNYVVASFS